MSRYSFPFFPVLTRREREIELLYYQNFRETFVSRGGAQGKRVCRDVTAILCKWEGGYACLARGTILQILPTYHFISSAFYLDRRSFSKTSEKYRKCYLDEMFQCFSYVIVLC